MISVVAASIREKTFYLIVNTPQIGRHQKDVYLYAISKNGLAVGDEIEFTKKSGLPSIKVDSGIIKSDNINWGCYLRLAAQNRYKETLEGTYEAKYTTDNGLAITRYGFIKPKTRILNTKGVYTVTVYPETSGMEGLAGANIIGVSWSPGCYAIRWCKGRRRNINTGPKLTLTSTKDAGLYTISRGSRGKRGWFVQIKVIVASCQEDQYLSGGSCVDRTVTTCDNGGVPKDEDDECLIPPYFTDYTCAPDPDFCPSDWYSFGGIDYRCYQAFDTQMEFQDYENFCQSQNGHLASFHTQAELNGVVGRAEALTGSFYIGLNDRDVEGQFCYTDNSMFTLNDFDTGEPNDGGSGEDCVQIRISNSRWNDVPCSTNIKGICMQVPCLSFVLGQEAGATLRCEDLKGGNPTCRGFLICLGDLYGCKCASGWYGNNCDRPCYKGKWGPGCELDCPQTEKNCNRFTGPTQ
ncbi:Neurocan core protein [Holothuria leucospilota]|uniref:Neurocan core protein n=1 Tax=Holothuria leucospilota TaxID=206669 RepID=A0A9Q1HLZ7_HOLLE|nr:Neurocan core protein [Holothuria leucospilota]